MNGYVIALYIGMALQEAGYQVMGPVSRLDDCLKLIEGRVPDLALVDINLESDGNGIDVARTLLNRWQIMSIFVSAKSHEARQSADAAIGCLHKPFATKSLVESVEIARTIKGGAKPDRLPEGLELFAESYV